ncbi:hypothetical protein [Oceanobacillus saliphilus]|uniref:hypothetical protein n=1 Tax=Oceanobacillus saliphilus TaxID=2925834 RepID=UPI00201E6950|nr:hypothetical protein [Oceanobacillus saliphilus]
MAQQAQQVEQENFLGSVVNMENALANTLSAASASPNFSPPDLERLLRLIIK